MTQRPPDQNILDDAWDHVVGGLDWLKSVLLGEFSDHRPLSAVVTDMLASFIPGVVIVTSARDAVAVVLRLANHPEKRDELMEWVLLSACLIVIALPLAMAAGGAAAAGVGAIVGGIAGSELGAALRAVMLMLIKEAQKLVELVQFLRKFIKGDILKFLRAVKFVEYEKALLQAMSKITGKLLHMVKALRTHLESPHYFDSVKAVVVKLAEWERRFYAVQEDALTHMPKALAELDARLAKILSQTAPKEVHTVGAGVETDATLAALPATQRVRDTPGKVLPTREENVMAAVPIAKGAAAPTTKVSSKPKVQPEAPPKDGPNPIKPADSAPNTKKQAVADATVAAERETVTQLSKEGKINEARAVLQRYVDAAANAKTSQQKEAAMEAIIARLDVSSDKQKMFWSGNRTLAERVATEKGKTILEQTPGGKVIDGWHDIDKTFPWNKDALRPNGWDFWGEVSANYSLDAVGEIDVIQDFKKFPAGGDTWRGREWPTIRKSGKVTFLNIFSMDSDGKILDVLTFDSRSAETNRLFGGR